MTTTSGEAQFTVFQPNLAPQQLWLPPQTITLGRASDCTIPIKDRFLSRRHAEIIFDGGQWLVRDCGSVNGTLLNGAKLTAPAVLKAGDRISLGDSEVVFQSPDTPSRIIAIDSDSHAKNLAIPMREAVDERGRDRVIVSLALRFIEERPMSELFDFILDRVVEYLHPSRVALALLAADGKTFASTHLRRSDTSDSTDLVISRTLLGEVIEERSVISYVDTAQDAKLARAESIIGQHIRSAVCAPLLVGDAVLGVLYLDFLATRGVVSHEDIRLIAQIARFASVKLETTRLREEALAKARLDEELRTAYEIQSRLLPRNLPQVEGYTFAGTNKPCKTVSGDYYDVVTRPDGRIYFIIADVSGKGITAALVMTGLATAFNIFTQDDPSPAQLVKNLNLTLTPKTAPAKFVTLVAGVLHPQTGVIEFANAGHVPPLILSSGNVTMLDKTDLVVGLFERAMYKEQTVTLGLGESLLLFTDGVTEAENADEDQLGLPRVVTIMSRCRECNAASLLAALEKEVLTFAGAVPMGDDVTMMAISRSA